MDPIILVDLVDLTRAEYVVTPGGPHEISISKDDILEIIVDDAPWTYIKKANGTKGCT